MVDHQIAHIYVRDVDDVARVRDDLRETPGVGEVASPGEICGGWLNHPNSGELIVTASKGYWLAYPWWELTGEEPDYARHVDIHNKPGYDPCELFWGWPPGSVSRNAERVGGSHGLTGPGREACWAGTFLEEEPLSLVELAGKTRQWLEAMV